MHPTHTDAIDLGTPVAEDMAVWPTGPKPRFERAAWAAVDGVTGTDIARMSMHTGSHVDAPAHYMPEGNWIDDHPIGKFMGEGLALDLSHLGPRSTIDRKSLEAFDDAIHDGDVVMCHTGWSNKRGWTEEYLFEFPYLTEGAGAFLRERDAKAVGVDTLSVGGFDEEVPNQGPVADTPAKASHLALFEGDVLPIEVLNNLDALLEGRATRRAYFHYAPVRFARVEAAPVRPTAVPIDAE